MENVATGSKQMEVRDHVSIDIETPYLQLATSMRSKLKTLYPLSGECTIHRIPERLRQLDEKMYKPRVVSIGPIFLGREELKAMEEWKERYLKRFLERTEVSLEGFTKVIKEKEEKLRGCYEETFGLDSIDFVKMVLVDAAFIIEVLLTDSENKSFDYDRLYGPPNKILDVWEDMYLLENQLPFFILEDIFTKANINRTSEINERMRLLRITHAFTKNFLHPLGIGRFEDTEFSEVKHLVHFVRICMVPSELKKEKQASILKAPSVTELHQAGVKFKVGSTTNLFKITFTDGILEMPRIRVTSPLKQLLKNLLAFEQCQYSDNLLNDYIIFLNLLVRIPKDVELLVKHEIIENPLGDSKRVTTIIQNLVEEIGFQEDFYFSSLVDSLNGYCRGQRHKWKATLKHDYFKTPWTTISVIAAVILLVLTFIQTLCSILQVK